MSDPFLVVIGINLSRPRAPRKLIKCGNTKAIDRSQFTADLVNPGLVSASPDNVEVLVDLYISVLSEPLESQVPEEEKVVPDPPSSPWMNNDIIKAKQARRRAERRKRKSGLVVHIQVYKQARNNVSTARNLAKACYFQAKLKQTISD